MAARSFTSSFVAPGAVNGDNNQQRTHASSLSDPLPSDLPSWTDRGEAEEGNQSRGLATAEEGSAAAAAAAAGGAPEAFSHTARG
jgi:hypothetical protein